MRYPFLPGSASTPAFDSHVIKGPTKGRESGKMKTGAKQPQDGNPQFPHSAWSKSGQIRVNPGKKIKTWPRPCRAEVRRRRIRTLRWLLLNLPHANPFQLLSFMLPISHLCRITRIQLKKTNPFSAAQSGFWESSR